MKLSGKRSISRFPIWREKEAAHRLCNEKGEGRAPEVARCRDQKAVRTFAGEGRGSFTFFQEGGETTYIRVPQPRKVDLHVDEGREKKSAIMAFILTKREGKKREICPSPGIRGEGCGTGPIVERKEKTPRSSHAAREKGKGGSLLHYLHSKETLPPATRGKRPLLVSSEDKRGKEGRSS